MNEVTEDFVLKCEGQTSGMTLNEQIGAKLRQIRTSKGWSLETLSEKTGITYQYLSRLENGHNTTIDTLGIIVKALGCKLTVLIEEKPKK